MERAGGDRSWFAGQTGSSLTVGSPLLPSRLLLQQFERVRPLVSKEAGDAPQHAERLNRPRRLGASHILALPAELIQDAPDLSLGGFIAAADEHGRLRAAEIRVHHERVADAGE